GREDLAAVERYEISVIQGYLPQPLSEAEVEALVAAAIAESGAAGPQDMGKVIGLLKPRVAGRADMGALSGLVRKKLAG
uniref:GatB/YqeY domain-containing protein n=1 Tax=Salmonella enterica TaxID=28901 RepID=UPI0032999B08